jgi:hypothetical protein
VLDLYLIFKNKYKLKKMKESELIQIKNKVEALIRLFQQMMNENQHLTTLAMGTLETVKLMPGYDEALKSLIEKNKAAQEEPREPEEVIDLPKLEL